MQNEFPRLSRQLLEFPDFPAYHDLPDLWARGSLLDPMTMSIGLAV